MAAPDPSRHHADLFRAIDLGMVVMEVGGPTDGRLRVVDANDAARLLACPGMPAAPAVGRTFDESFPALQGLGVEMFLKGVATTGIGDSVELVLSGGGRVDSVLSLRAVPLPDHRVGMVVEDATTRRHQLNELIHMARHDPLTGLANRSAFIDRVEEGLASASETSRLVVAMLDIDRFKGVNDVLGHSHGDRLLVELGQRLSRLATGGGLVARMGGDEFAVVAPLGARSPDGFVSQITAALARPFDIHGIAMLVTASIGAAIAPDHTSDAQELLHYADVAMYAAKRTGRRSGVYRPEDDLYVLRRRQMLGDLREAIETDALELYYQPKVDIEAGGVTGVEALLRWTHPRWGEISPAEFVPIAESTGLIGPLTMWVLDRCGRQSQEWSQRDLNLGVSANISARNLYDPSLVRSVTRLLGRDAHGGRLTLELTETQIVEDLPMARQLLQRIRAMGVRLSIDDFGTGYSSLAYLKGLPLDELKIDRSFCGEPGESHSTTIVQSIVALGHDLGLHVVAEGVESPDAWDWIAGLGCDAVQGHHVSEAKSVIDLEAWLEDGPFPVVAACG